MTTLNYDIEIPQKLITDYRTMYSDTPEHNRLIEGVESSDDKIRLAFQLWLSDFNKMPPKLASEYSATDFPNYEVMFTGAMLKLLTMTGILQTRNFLNFNDSGVSYTVGDKGRDYMQWISMMYDRHRQEVRDLKKALNAEEAYDFIPSPYYAWNSDFLP